MIQRFQPASSPLWKAIKEAVQSLGIVFGDIGTSPIYTLSVVFLLTPVTSANVLGVLSLIVWTLTLLVFVQYIILVMGLGKKGEGGTIVLKELLVPLLKSNRQIAVASFLAFIGISLLFGDGVLTPAMGILSALEGIKFLAFFKALSQTTLLLLASCIATLLFVLQKMGVERVSVAFGPLMLTWFCCLATTGLISITSFPLIIKALNPYYAINFIVSNGFPAFFVFSEVILCATGAEAIYADMGHLGRKPIRQASFFVFLALLLTYLGQGAFLLQNPNAKQVFYEMVAAQSSFFYVPFLLLSLFATVIASQAMISGIFSAVYQGITTQVLPRLKIDYTSSKFRSQIFVGVVNWFLLCAVIVIIWQFKQSHKLAAAYGLAVTGSMTITGIMMSWIFYLRRNYFKVIISSLLTMFTMVFLFSNLFKIPNGGYWSIMLALIPLSIILIYSQGKKKVAASVSPMPLEKFLTKFNKTASHPETNRIKGTALFFAKNLNAIAPYIVQTMFKNNIIYEDNIIISIITRDDPFGVIGFFKGELAPGLRIFEIHMGYMEIIDIEKILHNAGINAKVIFYGLKEIVSQNPFWRCFALLKRVTPTIVQFYKLPPYKLHGVVTLVKM